MSHNIYYVALSRDSAGKPNFRVYSLQMHPGLTNIKAMTSSRLLSAKLAKIEHAVSKKMRLDGAPPLAIQAFIQNLRRWQLGHEAYVPEASLAPLGKVPTFGLTRKYIPLGKSKASRVVMIKLNGGLGTNMGLTKAKSLLEARAHLTFLDLIVHQIEYLRKQTKTSIPLLFMDSFSTHRDTLVALAEKHPDFHNDIFLPLSFCQHRVPKLDPASGMPVLCHAHPADAWCPPGHADLYCALQTTGILQKLLRQGYAYAFVSNADNLGASLDFGILGYLMHHGLPFLMEVTPRTESDKKGGHLARNVQNGRLILRELAQCPPAETSDFQNIRKHRFFNTNNLWMDLRAVAKMLESHNGVPPFPLLVNRKRVVPSDKNSPPCVQLESAMGAAISEFDRAQALVVPRTRFAPVKMTEDLLNIRSDAYHMAPDFRVELASSRHGIPPEIRLDSRFYAILSDFNWRFPLGKLSLKQCKAIGIDGDFTFGKDCKVDGRVFLAATGNESVFIPSRTRLGK